MKERKLVVVKDSGPIPELNFVCGPILVPTKIDLKVIIKMIGNGRSVFECNPYNTDDQVKLELTNVKNNNFETQATKPVVESVKENEKKEVVNEPEKNESSVEEKKSTENVTEEKAVVAEPEAEESETVDVVEEAPEESVEEIVKEEKPVTNNKQNNQQNKNKNKNNKNRK